MKYINTDNLEKTAKALKNYTDKQTVEAKNYTDKQIEAVNQKELASLWATID